MYDMNNKVNRLTPHHLIQKKIKIKNKNNKYETKIMQRSNKQIVNI